MLIISYETLLLYKDSLMVPNTSNSKPFKFDLMICDEGHRLKNEKVKIFKTLAQINCKSRIIITGTPIQNNLTELYSCIRFIYPVFNINFDKFKKVYIDPINAALGKGATKEQITDAEAKSKALNEIVNCMMLRRTETVLQKFLPARNEYYVYLRPTLPEIIIYNKAI